MSKRPVTRMSEAEAKGRYPIADRVPGWFFRVEEISAGAWRVEGTDLDGRTVARTGSDPHELLAECCEDARKVAR